MERHGEKVGENCMVEQCLHSDSQCGCKSAASLRWENLFVGKVSCETTMNQNVEK